MVVDASAVIAVLNYERRGSEIATALDVHLKNDGQVYMPPTAVFEAVIGLARAGARPNKANAGHIERACAVVRSFIAALSIKETQISSEVAAKALEAAARFGAAVGHPAGLNFGDCFAYATAKAYRSPLLFIGDDFIRTDIESVLANPSP